jgi:hypothetical protein
MRIRSFRHCPDITGVEEDILTPRAQKDENTEKEISHDFIVGAIGNLKSFLKGCYREYKNELGLGKVKTATTRQRWRSAADG